MAVIKSKCKSKNVHGCFNEHKVQRILNIENFRYWGSLGSTPERLASGSYVIMGKVVD